VSYKGDGVIVVAFELNGGELNTPKALANFSPGLLQPWEEKGKDIKR
jgi:hypothetical protein